MSKRFARKAALVLLLLGTASLGGCIVAPYPGYYRPYHYGYWGGGYDR